MEPQGRSAPQTIIRSLMTIGWTLLLAGPALAGPPDPARSICPQFVSVSPDSTCCFDVIVRDFANNPVPGSFVRVGFENCPGLTLCSTQPPGIVIVGQGVATQTDATGRAHFCICGNVAASCPATITADGVVLCQKEVRGSCTNLFEFTLDPVFAQNLTGIDHTVTAKQRDANGNPASGVPVTFNVTAGPNLGLSGSDVTDPNGEATFTFTSALSGFDTIVASDFVGHSTNTVQKQWFTPGPNENCNGLDDNGDGRSDEGFPDRDGDGIADCIDSDDDDDAVDDGQDNCPFTPNTDQADANHNGIGDACESPTPPIVNPPASGTIEVDGQFGPPTAEWFGVTPATFLAGASKVYTVVDPATNAIGLLYDVSTSTTALSPGDRVGPVSFQVGGGSFFDVFVVQGGPNTEFAPNPPTSSGGAGDVVEVFLNGVPFDNSAGCVVGAVDRNTTSPNFAVSHNLVELEVKLTGNPGGCYSPEPAFWSATLPTVQPSAQATRGRAEVLGPGASDPQLVSAAFFTIAEDGSTTLNPITEAVTGVIPMPAPRSGVLFATPNPFKDETSILLTLPVSQEVEVSVTDVSGRSVWRSPRAQMTAGQHRIPWHGQDEFGRQVHAGMYFVQVRGADGLDLRKTVIRLR